jgi:dipeptidyl aminopeptidase/acylaminoacyl peptidase
LTIIERIEAIDFLRSAEASPDGRLVALVHSGVAGDADSFTLAILDAASGTVLFECHSSASISRPSWSPDGDALATTEMAGDRRQILLVEHSGDGWAGRTLDGHAHGVRAGSVGWSPDGAQLAFLYPVNGPRDPAAPIRVTRRFWRHEGQGLVDDNLSGIGIVDRKGGAVRVLDIPLDRVLSQPTFSPDGKHVAFKSAFDPADEAAGPSPELSSVDLASGDVRGLVPAGLGWMARFAFIDAHRIALVSSTFKPGASRYGNKLDLFVVDLRTGERSNRTAGWPTGLGSRFQADMCADWGGLSDALVVSADKGRALVTGERAGRTEILEIALDGPESVTIAAQEPTASLAIVGAAADGLIVARTSLGSPPHLLRYAPAGQTSLTAAADLPLDVRRHRIDVDGTHRMDVWIVVPPGAAGPTKTVLKVHGGPYGSFGEVFFSDVHMLVEAGYAVVFHNFRGSYGYGDAFAQSISAHWGKIGEIDHHAAIDFAIAAGIADPQQLAVIGISHGGFASAWLASRSDRFKAGVVENPNTDLRVSFGVSDIASWYQPHEAGLDPFEDEAGYADRSAMHYAQQCRTPLLFIQGERDLRCTPDQSLGMFGLLRYLGRTAEMLLIPDGNHMATIVGPVAYRRARLAATLDWLDRHVPVRSKE